MRGARSSSRACRIAWSVNSDRLSGRVMPASFAMIAFADLQSIPVKRLMLSSAVMGNPKSVRI